MYENPLPPVPQDTPNPYIMPANTPNPDGGNEWARRRREQLRGWASANPARVSTYDQASFARSGAKPVQAEAMQQGPTKPNQPTKPYSEYTDSQTASVQPGKFPQAQQFGAPKPKLRPYNI